MIHVLSKKNRALLRELVITDFKLRYQGSILGYAWSLLKPLFMFAILYVVFTMVFKVGKEVPYFPIYLLLGVVLWSFFVEMTQQSLTAIVGRGDLIRKIRIPRWLVIVSVSIGALINLLLNLVVVLALAVINGMEWRLTGLQLPLYILEIYVFALGLSLILSALYVKYRDINYIWEVMIQAGFYATPILYPITTVANLVPHETLLKLLYLNPLAQALQGARNSFVTTVTLSIWEIYGTPFAILLPLAVVAIFLGIGIIYFRRQSESFAENL